MILCFFCSDIIRKVKEGGPNPYRPNVWTELPEMPDLIDVIKLCWLEVAPNRPTFDTVLRRIKRISKGR